MKRLVYRFTWHLTTLSHVEPQSEPRSHRGSGLTGARRSSLAVPDQDGYQSGQLCIFRCSTWFNGRLPSPVIGSGALVPEVLGSIVLGVSPTESQTRRERHHQR